MSNDKTSYIVYDGLKVIVLLLSFLFVATIVSGATCEEQCQTSCAISTQEVCDACISACESSRRRRVKPISPPWQPGVDYSLHRTIGFTVLDYKYEDFPGWPGVVRDIRDAGFTTSQLWVRYSQLYCMGQWILPYPSHEWMTYNPNCETAQMLRFGGSTQLFIKLDPYMSQQLVRFLMNRWYELAWWKDLTIVFSRWEQDNYLAQQEISYDEYMRRWLKLKAEEEEIQRWVTEERLTLKRRYPYSSIEILNAMVVNRFPGTNVKPWAEGWPTVTDMIAEMENKPDLIGISYWKRGLDPIPALDWVRDTTLYPQSRIFIAEFGARYNEQPERFLDYIPAFWNWGARTVLIWAWRSPWDEDLYSPTPEGLAALRELNIRAIDWEASDE